MRLPAQVTVCEVGPRDGLQTEQAAIATADKVRLVDLLSAAGLPKVEAASFVHPKLVPQMADAAQVMAQIARRPGAVYRCLIPNLRGVELAIAAGAQELVLPVAASETFNGKNLRRTVAETMAEAERAVAHAHAAGVRYVVGIATAFGCPYEGDVDEARVLGMVAQSVRMGADAVSLADTTGMANPAQVRRLCLAVRERWPDLPLALHFHNTRGMGLANVLAGLEAGVTEYDASVGGLGGCPYAPKATGNICTADLVHMLHEMGIETGIDLEKLLEAAHLAEALVGRTLPGLVMKAGPRWLLHGA